MLFLRPEGVLRLFSSLLTFLLFYPFLVNLLGLCAWKGTVIRSTLIFVVFLYYFTLNFEKIDELHIFLTKNIQKLFKFAQIINSWEFWQEGSGVSLGTQLVVAFWVYVTPPFSQGLGVLTLYHSEMPTGCTFWGANAMWQYCNPMPSHHVEHDSLLGQSILMGSTLRI